MRTTALPRPGLLLGAYPERRPRDDDALTRAASGAQARLASLGGFHSRRYADFVARVRQAATGLDVLTPVQLREKVAQIRARLTREGLADPVLTDAFALVSEGSARALAVRPYDGQLMAARIMLDNRLAEMATGEGKTLAATVCAATAALAGIPVHVVTANDYLVARDAEGMRPLYAALGLSVGSITQALGAAGRQYAYACDIVYCTAKELAFDYLRDSLVRGRARNDLELRASQLAGGAPAARRTLLRGLCMAIVDEADSTLIDEARIPLVLSEASASLEQVEYGRHAFDLARVLTVAEHFALDPARMSAALTTAGAHRLERDATQLGPVWRNRAHREEAVCTTLAALYLYRRDYHYVVRDGAVLIVDETTGRLAQGRIWSRGLHQAIELKEGCEPSPELVTAAQITFQRFFQRYLWLGGMSGTLSEARSELQSVYGLSTVEVPLRRPCRRLALPTRLFPDEEARWKAVVQRAGEISGKGRPVLIGTDSVSASEALSKRLTEAGLEHAVLNARQDRTEAQVIASAGEQARITVATNMAGRGTDIALGPGVASLGGLHVLSCQHNASRRIDRQLTGRCARQGDPGSVETFIALDQPLISRWVPRRMSRFAAPGGILRPAWLIALIRRTPQLFEEARQRSERRALLRHDARSERDPLIGGSP